MSMNNCVCINVELIIILTAVSLVTLVSYNTTVVISSANQC